MLLVLNSCTVYMVNMDKTWRFVTLYRAKGLWVLCGGNLASAGRTSCPREKTSRPSSPSRSVVKWSSSAFIIFSFESTSPSLSIHQKLQLVLSDGSGPDAAQAKRILSLEELSQQLERLLLEDMASDEQIFDWVEVREDGCRLPVLIGERCQCRCRDTHTQRTAF